MDWQFRGVTWCSRRSLLASWCSGACGAWAMPWSISARSAFTRICLSAPLAYGLSGFRRLTFDGLQRLQHLSHQLIYR